MSEVHTEILEKSENNSFSPEKGQENKLNTSLEKIEIASTKKMTEVERMQQRLKKFGAQNENTKKNERAKRFGEASASGDVTEVDGGKLKKRAERFGTAAIAVAAANEVDKDALEKRAKRFGETNQDGCKDEVLSKRKERFGVVDEDAKKKLRSQRFQSK